jgi:hypothetical protein
MEDLLPTEFYLSQNHPNPFKERTTIKYCVPEESRIKLEIFDSRKEKIKTLIDEIKEPGTYQVEFNPNGFDEGIYLYQLTAGGVILTKKMTLLKK